MNLIVRTVSWSETSSLRCRNSIFAVILLVIILVNNLYSCDRMLISLNIVNKNDFRLHPDMYYLSLASLNSSFNIVIGLTPQLSAFLKRPDKQVCNFFGRDQFLLLYLYQESLRSLCFVFSFSFSFLFCILI